MKTINIILIGLLVLGMIHALADIPDTWISYPWQTAGHDEEYIPTATLCANTYFDSNGNQQMDDSDTMIMNNINFTFSTEFFQYPTHDEYSSNGGFCAIVPEGKTFVMSLNDSSEELNKITDPNDQFPDSGNFRFRLIDNHGNIINPGMLNKSVAWEIEGTTDVDILIIRI